MVDDNNWTYTLAFANVSCKLLWWRALIPLVAGISEVLCTEVSDPVAPCFHQSLPDVLRRDGRHVPIVIDECLRYLRSKNAHAKEGIFRISGPKGDITDLHQVFETNIDVTIPDTTDVNTVSGVLKMFLKELPEPLLTWDLFDHCMQIPKLSDGPPRIDALRRVLSELPYDNQICLATLLQYMTLINAHSATSKMSFTNLAIVFGPNVLRKQDAKPEEEIAWMQTVNQVVMMVMQYADQMGLPSRFEAQVTKWHSKKCPKDTTSEESVLANDGLLVSEPGKIRVGVMPRLSLQ
jgi:hypothetical protein